MTRSTYSLGNPHAGAALDAQSRWNFALQKKSLIIQSFVFWDKLSTERLPQHTFKQNMLSGADKALFAAVTITFYSLALLALEPDEHLFLTIITGSNFESVSEPAKKSDRGISAEILFCDSQFCYC